MGTALKPAEKLFTEEVNRLIKEISPRHRQWIDTFLSSGLNAAAANKVCGYKSAPHHQLGYFLENQVTRAYLEHELALIRQQHWIRREQLLAKMRRLNDFNLMNIASRSSSGWLEINQDDYERVAEEIGDCVTELEIKDDGTVRIKLMDKDKMFDRELQYAGIMDMKGNVNIQITNSTGEGRETMDWDKLAQPVDDTEDVIEGEILKAEEAT